MQNPRSIVANRKDYDCLQINFNNRVARFEKFYCKTKPTI